MAEKYEDSKLYKVRHSAAHVMAQAVSGESSPPARSPSAPLLRMVFITTLISPDPLTPEDLDEIEGRMREIIKNDSPI